MTTSTTQSTSTPPKITADSAPVREQLLHPGDLVGHCRVIELIAAGGMANVYKVWHEQLEVIRAIKILKPGFTEEAQGRLATEAKISANLRHSNIVEIYGMGYWNEIPYLEMEYVDGPSLKELLEKNIRLPISFSLSVVHCVCTALQFAFNQDMTLYGKVYDSLIHRDIKPANILISSKGIVKLADFGIARPSDVSIHTVGSKVMGTFAYLSPEQLNGEKLDQRSDVYSLGTVLYEMLTGSKTFPQKLLAELVQRKSRGQFIPVGSMGIKLSRPLCLAVEKSLALDQSKRYVDAGEFNVELSACLRKMSSKTPEEIILAYLKNPYSPGMRKKPIIDLFVLMRYTGITLAVLLVIIGTIRIYPQVKTFYFRIRSIIGSLTAITQTVDKQTSSTPAQKKNTEKSDSIVATIPAGKPVFPKPEPEPEKSFSSKPAETSTENPLTVALNFYNNGDYTKAITALETVEPPSLSTAQKTLRVIRLLQAYINTSRYEDAHTLIENESVSDGFFHLLKSEVYYKRNKLDKALVSARKAENLSSSHVKALSRKATFQVATILHARYFLKPNEENLQTARREWNAYLSAYCTDSFSSECKEAREKIEMLDF